MCFRIVLIMASACEFDESRKMPITSEIPPSGRPLWALVHKANKTPAQAPRLPSQFSGLGSSLYKYLLINAFSKP